MPRDVTGNYDYPAGTRGVPNAKILSARYNAFLDDLKSVLNAAYPVNKGGTGAITADQARTNLGAAGIFATRTALKAMTATAVTAGTVVILTEGSRVGRFIWRTGDYSTLVADDTQEGWYIAHSTLASTVGAFVRDEHEGYQVAHCGSVADAVDTGTAFTGTDNAVAFQAAFDFCGKYRKTLHISGQHKLGAIAAENEIRIRLKHHYYDVRGINGGAIFFDENLALSLAQCDFIANNTTGEAYTPGAPLHEYFGMRDLTIRARWTHGYQANQTLPGSALMYPGPNCLHLRSWGRVELLNCNFSDFRARFSRSYGIDSLLINGCKLSRCGAGGFRFDQTFKFIVTGNVLEAVDDDAIQGTIYGTEGTGLVRHEMVVANNVLIQCEGMLFAAPQALDISNNRLYFCHGTGISVGFYAPGSGGAGDGQPWGIRVCGNSIINQISRVQSDGTMLPSTSLQGCLDLYGMPLTKVSTNNTYVGNFNTTAGRMEAPWSRDSFSREGARRIDHTVRSSIGGWSFICEGNIIERNAYWDPTGGTVKFSTYGIGLMFERFGWQDPDVSRDHWRQNGIQVGGDIDGVLITNNVVRGLRNAGILFVDTVSGSNPLEGREHRQWANVKIKGNLFQDLRNGWDITWAVTNPATPYTLDGCDIIDNDFDCDPYLQNEGRTGTNGAWNNTAAFNLRSTGILCRSCRGLRIERNSFRNCYVPIFTGPSPDTLHYLKDNVVICQPTATGYNAANKGVGDVPQAGALYTHRIWDCDPQSATYRQPITEPLLQSAAMPSAGTYVAGHFTKSTSLASPLQIGWLRLTTGSAHVLNTDWKLVSGV